jgi:hypothetical protein
MNKIPSAQSVVKHKTRLRFNNTGTVRVKKLGSGQFEPSLSKIKK